MPASPPDPGSIDQKLTDLTDFQSAKITFSQLESDWKEEVVLTEAGRKLRKFDVNRDKLRSDKKLLPDETIICTRLIDTNINREAPAFIGYLKQARRLVIFKCRESSSVDTQVLEQAFTDGMTYLNWEKPLFRVIDGAQAHGWDTVEVTFDETKPLNLAIEHRSHDRVFFPQDIENIQDAEIVLVKRSVTRSKLREWIDDYGFNKLEVEKVSKLLESNNRYKSVDVYKVFFRHEGLVYTGWCSLQGCDDWLKKPEPLFLGRQKMTQTENVTYDPVTFQPVTQMVYTPSKVYETMYPLFVLPYDETEDDPIAEKEGRCKKDKSKQEAMSSMWSSFVNGLYRASNIYASPDQPTGTGQPAKTRDVNLEHGKIYSEPLKFWHPDYPDPIVLQGASALDTFNSQEVGQINFAAQNRKDSRKTATEISAAQREQASLSTVQVTLFSTFIRELYTYVWELAQNYAQFGLITLKDVPPDLLQLTYDLKAAGDVDVIQRSEKIAAMKQDWPVISQTGLAMQFLLDILRLQYPEDIGRYTQTLQAGDQKKNLINKLATVLKGSMSPEELQALPPEQQQQLQQLEQEVVQAMQQP